MFSTLAGSRIPPLQMNSTQIFIQIFIYSQFMVIFAFIWTCTFYS